MISLLKGKVAEKSLGRVIVDVHGVGYGVTVPLSTYYRLPEDDAEVKLKIYTHVKEDAIELYGFLTEDERRIFLDLIEVSGIGPKAATNILSSISPAELVTAVTTGELARKKIPGIGPKLASRLITELKDKFAKLKPKGEGIATGGGILEDVISALMNLGYTKPEIDEHIGKLEAAAAKEKSIEAALRESLKIMRRV